MQLLDMFSGGAFSQASIFALGIMPYITASIVIQLMGMVVPSFQKMQREGESGRMKLNQYTRYLTVLILLVQAPAYLINLKYQVVSAGGTVEMGVWTMFFLTIVLTAGAMFIMWLGEKITDKGIGNGISMIILVGIIARFPGALVAGVHISSEHCSGWFGDVPGRDHYPVCCHGWCCDAHSGNTQGTRAICQAPASVPERERIPCKHGSHLWRHQRFLV